MNIASKGIYNSVSQKKIFFWILLLGEPDLAAFVLWDDCLVLITESSYFMDIIISYMQWQVDNFFED